MSDVMTDREREFFTKVQAATRHQLAIYKRMEPSINPSINAQALIYGLIRFCVETFSEDQWPDVLRGLHEMLDQAFPAVSMNVAEGQAEKAKAEGSIQ